MKKTPLAVLLIALLVLMSACSKTNESTESDDIQQSMESGVSEIMDALQDDDGSENTNAPKSTDKTKKDEKSEVKELISELFSEDGTGYARDGTEYTYSYHVPQIKDDTPDTASMTEYIEYTYGTMVELAMDCVNSNEAPAYVCVDYESYLNGTVLSLVMKTISYDDYVEEYEVYNYDLETGEQIINDDLLAKLDVTEAQYLLAVRRAAAATFDDGFFPIDIAPGADYAYDLGVLNERRSATLSSTNISTYLPIYLDNNGALNAIVPIGSFVGADWTYQPLLLDTHKVSARLEATYSDFLSATLKGNELSITINKTAKALELFNGYGIEKDPPYGKAISVHGCYSDYTDMLFLCLPGSPVPRLFLLTEDGRVEYVMLEKGIVGDYCCVCGPMPVFDRVVSLREGTDQYGWATTCAVLENGDFVDLADLNMLECISMSERFGGAWLTTITHTTDGGGSYEEFYSLEMPVGGDNVRVQKSVFDAGLTTLYSGYFEYYGMAEDGAVYLYHLWDEDTDELCRGVAALRNSYFTDDYGYQSALFLKELSGDGIIYSEPGETTRFEESFG